MGWLFLYFLTAGIAEDYAENTDNQHYYQCRNLTFRSNILGYKILNLTSNVLHLKSQSGLEANLITSASSLFSFSNFCIRSGVGLATEKKNSATAKITL
ncbi:hypothetical protein SAMN06265367_101700 [Algoriphagus winogradskyi]|uniref:Secreted protein n=1 Tax=Algoriphagus winogradskyi TaxID=237017 RepID=A0ABY1NFG1_9BACT|nr:hypothetical protein SAMN06265367_101700 [Algoriphagus winogradskyi]